MLSGVSRCTSSVLRCVCPFERAGTWPLAPLRPRVGSAAPCCLSGQGSQQRAPLWEGWKQGAEAPLRGQQGTLRFRPGRLFLLAVSPVTADANSLVGLLWGADEVRGRVGLWGGGWVSVPAREMRDAGTMPSLALGAPIQPRRWARPSVFLSGADGLSSPFLSPHSLVWDLPRPPPAGERGPEEEEAEHSDQAPCPGPQFPHFAKGGGGW